MLNKELEDNFVELLEKHQNIVHKVCRLYTYNYDAHNDLFQEITIQLWKAVVTQNLVRGCIVLV